MNLGYYKGNQLQAIADFLEIAVGYVWGVPLALMSILAGVYLTIVMRGVQFRGFFHSWACISGKYDDPKETGEVTHFQALSSALSATIGLGNIAGVAIAITVGGPGALFWMWVVAFFGMATKFTECSAAVMFRDKHADGSVSGGPMYYIRNGLGEAWKPLAGAFAILAGVSSFGIGNMFQANQMADALYENFSIPKAATAVVVVLLVGLVIIGGIKRIGKVASKIVPIMVAFYVLGALYVILSNYEKIPECFALIFRDAFTGEALGGGMVGALITGAKRATFSNEAGLGSAPIAHAAARTNVPIREGVVALLEPFLDTILVCTMTALVIIITGFWQNPAHLGGSPLTTAAFDSAIPGYGKYIVTAGIVLFAYSTMISWSYYGEKCFRYLFGEKAVMPYKIIFLVLLFVGAIWKLAPVINLSDIMNGFMMLPNIVAIIALSSRMAKEANRYFERLEAGEFEAKKNK
ncbi:MAG: sodium:alanine symporter family protein [Myxococcota bacterium]